MTSADDSLVHPELVPRPKPTDDKITIAPGSVYELIQMTDVRKYHRITDLYSFDLNLPPSLSIIPHIIANLSAAFNHTIGNQINTYTVTYFKG